MNTSESWRRAWLAYGAVALVPALVLADTAAALARGWRLDSRLDMAALAAVAIMLASATGAMCTARGRNLLARRAPHILVLAFAMALVCSAAEVALGPYLRSQADPLHLRRPHSHIVNHPMPGVMPGVSGESHVTANSLGVRGPEPPPRSQAYRILCLGGSTTAGTYLDDSETWPQRLLDVLNESAGRQYWVGNAGLPSLSTIAHLQFINESDVMRQIDCLVVQAGINDWMTALYGEKPAEPLWMSSRVWSLVHLARLRVAQSGDITVEDAAGKGYIARRAIRQAAPICDELPNLKAPLQEFENRVRAIVLACQRLGVRVVFTSQPVSWNCGLDEPFRKLLWFGAMRDGRFLSVDKMRAGMDRYNERLQRVCRELGVEWIDLGSLNGRQDVFYDDCHFTELGAKEVARLVAAGLNPSGPAADAKGAR